MTHPDSRLSSTEKTIIRLSFALIVVVGGLGCFGANRQVDDIRFASAVAPIDKEAR